MLSNLELSRTLVKSVQMSVPRKKVTKSAMQKEWLEVQAAQQDPAMFGVLYDRYFESIYLFIFKRTNDKSLADDICSQVFLKAMERLNKYVFKGVPFSAWLYRIASNEVAQYFRKAQKNRTVSIDDTNISDMLDEFDEEIDMPSVEVLVAALDNLKEGDLQLIELRFFEGLPYRDIAEILEITENNAKVRTFRITNRLKKKLS
jgi:RNA polymerase sigma-70 factor (ECF subfamily)